MARKKPKKGEISNERPTSSTLCQLSATPVLPGRNLYASPTPKIEPINECELEIGIPKRQLVRFQIMAVHINDMIIAIPCEILLSTNASTGRRFTIPIATAIPPKYTPVKFHIPDQITAILGFKELV